MAYTNSWDESKPLGSTNANTLDTIIQSLKLDIRQRMLSLGSETWITTDPVYFSSLKLGTATPKLLGTNGVTTSIKFRDSADSQTNLEIFENGDVNILGNLAVAGGISVAGEATTLGIPIAAFTGSLADGTQVNPSVSPIGPPGAGSTTMTLVAPLILRVGSILTNITVVAKCATTVVAPVPSVKLDLYKIDNTLMTSTLFATVTKSNWTAGVVVATPFAVPLTEEILDGFSYAMKLTLQSSGFDLVTTSGCVVNYTTPAFIS